VVLEPFLCPLKWWYIRLMGPVVQRSISAKPGLTLKKTYTVNPGLALIELWTTGPWSLGRGEVVPKLTIHGWLECHIANYYHDYCSHIQGIYCSFEGIWLLSVVKTWSACRDNYSHWNSVQSINFVINRVYKFEFFCHKQGLQIWVFLS